MDLSAAVEEIGILETNIQLEKYMYNYNMMKDISTYMPIPYKNSTKEIIDSTVAKLLGLNKKILLMLSNEIALVEGLSKFSEYFESIIIVLSRNLTKAQVENIKSNIPLGINIEFIKELEFPKNIKPKNSVVLSFGYKSGNKCLVTKNTYRMVEIYKNFLGEKIFVCCMDGDVNERPKNWVAINSENYFTKII